MSREEYAGQSPQLVPEAMRGYRFWRYERGATRIKGQYNGEWERLKPLEAACKANTYTYLGGFQEDEDLNHEVPSENCTCGIYARYVIDGHITNPSLVWNALYIVGSIKATGKTLLGSRGFRTAKAEIEAFVDIGLNYPEDDKFTKVLAENYGVPFYEDPKKFLEDFPPANLSALGIAYNEYPHSFRGQTYTAGGRRFGKEEQYRLWLAQYVDPPNTMAGCTCDSCHTIRSQYVSSIQQYNYGQNSSASYVIIDQQKLQEDTRRLQENAIRDWKDPNLAGSYSQHQITINMSQPQSNSTLTNAQLRTYVSLVQGKIDTNNILGGGA